MNKIIYIRPSLAEENEIEALKQLNIPFTTNRAAIDNNSTVIGRYSVLPYYDELVSELAFNGSKLLNSLNEHYYVADLGQYVYDLGELTPKTWSSLADVPQGIKGGLVLKGATNSKKHHWRTHMFAKDWNDALQVNLRLNEDSLIGTQNIYVRQYVPLVKLGETITGLPITKEFRFFVLNGQVIASSFYWSSLTDDIIEQGYEIPQTSEVPENFILDVISKLSQNVTFYAVDVAQDEIGRWWVIDVNDGQMSGLSGINPLFFYSTLYRMLS